MKRKLSILTALVLTLCVAFSGCADIAKVKEVPDASFAVIGNGGMSVQQGNSIYYVNGYADIKDEDGKTNVTGKVEKGGIYRVDLTMPDGTAPKAVTSNPNASALGADEFFDEYLGYYGSTYKTVETSSVSTRKEDSVTDFSGLKMQVNKDLTEKENGVVKEKEYAGIRATQIVSKKVSNGGNEAGGIYIFEGWIYYCSPVTKNNKEGVVQYKLTAFMRTRLNGSGTETIYETSNPDKTPTYGYYRYDGKTYLTVLDDGKLKSIACKDRGGKGAVYTLAENVAGVLFSTKPIYYTGMREDSAEDYVYYIYNATAEDVVPSGQVLCRVRPNNTDGMKLINDQTAITLRNVKNDYLYYSKSPADGKGSHLYANSFAGYPNKMTSALATTSENAQTSEIELMGLESISTIYPSNEINNFDPITKKTSVSHYCIAGTGSKTMLIREGSEPSDILEGESATVISVVGDTMYYYVEVRTNIAENPVLECVISRVKLTGSAALPEVITSGKAIVGQFVVPDISAGYLFTASTNSTVRQALDLNTNEGRKVSGYVHVRRVVGYSQEPEWTIEAFAANDLKEVEKTAETQE